MKDSRIPAREDYFPLELQISNESWNRYDISNGILLHKWEDAVPPSPYSFRILASRMNKKRDFTSFPSTKPARAGDLMAAGLINEIFRYVSTGYRLERNPDIFQEAITFIDSKHGGNAVAKTLETFIEEFPPYKVHRKETTALDYLKEKKESFANFNYTAKEMFLLTLSLENPALKQYRELFDDTRLARKAPYEHLMRSLEQYFAKMPGYGPLNQPLYKLLKTPVKESPDCLKGQLMYIRDNWKSIVSDNLLERILLTLDVIKEEEKMGSLGPGPLRELKFGREYLGYDEYERFSTDADWMSRVVLMAKMVYVWLDQLSHKYQRSITRLDQIPDQELDRLARWGFTGLWLIGLWERSSASQKIKQYCGNPEAAASAYSLYDYEISKDLGGNEALESLKERARIRGIRLASDMVPNHMGIFSKWVVEHPDWFVQLDYSPFPNYQFTGGNLSEDERVGIYIEDGYWDKRDAAVVFKRVDHWTGEEKYIYHGNDGTSMPWNDTAQLNFFNSSG